MRIDIGYGRFNNNESRIKVRSSICDGCGSGRWWYGVIDVVGTTLRYFIYDVRRTKNKELGNSRQNI